MTDSSSDSDCFESADEGFDDENNVKNDNPKRKSGGKDSNQPETPSFTSSGVSWANNQKESRETCPIASSLQYRKRPERGKSASKPLQPVSRNSRKTSLNEQGFKTDIINTDVLIQDITSNLSKNLNKGFSTIQQTSSSIKDLVISSLPVPSLRESSHKFSYDDDDDEEEEEEEEEGIRSQVFHSENDNKEFQTESLRVTIKNNVTDVNSEISGVRDIVGEALKSINKFEAADDKVIEEENVQEVENICNVASTKGSGDGIIENPPHFIDLKKEDVIPEETKDSSEDFVEEGCNKNKVKPIAEISVQEEPEKEKEIVQEDKVHTRDEEDNVITDFNGKNSWDSSGLELEVLDEIEETPTNAASCLMGSAIRKETKLEVKEEKQEVQKNEISGDNEGWDDFDIDDEELEVMKNENKEISSEDARMNNQFMRQSNQRGENKNFGNDTKWSGWDNFGEKQETKHKTCWNLGSWGVNALLNTATSVTQGLTNVIEAGLGVPDPETLARMEHEGNDNISEKMEGGKTEKQQRESSPQKADDNSSSGLNLFPSFGITNLVAGVTKNIVENTKVHEIGTKVIAGGLDTLESFGKKTMEVLQEGDPGLKKKRAMLLGSDKPILSQVLREAKSKAEMEDMRMEEMQMAKMCHFETLFDDYQGLIHLEALEMLSTQCELKLEQMKASLSTNEVEDLIGILDEVKELCIVDENEFKSNYSTMVDFKISLTKAIKPLKNEISIQKIVQVYEELDAWLKNKENTKKSPRALFQKAMSTLAELTAATVAQFHKGGELLSIKEHRKTVEEADALLQMTGFLCCEITSISQKFLKLHTSQLTEKDKEIALKIKEEANNATSYIKDAFNLLIPVLQLGAAI